MIGIAAARESRCAECAIHGSRRHGDRDAADDANTSRRAGRSVGSHAGALDS
jgi:hypothetical protein